MAMASWNRLSYPRQLFAWLLVYSLTLTACFLVFQYHREKDFKAEALNSQLQIINTYILDELAENRAVEQMDIREMHSFPDLRVSIIDSRGNVVYDNSIDSVPGSNHLGREEIAHAKSSGSGFTVRRHSQSTGQTYFYSARRGDDGTIVRTAVPYSVSLAGMLRADYGFLWIMGLVTLLFCAAGYFATRRIGLHVSRLKSFAESAEKGERIFDSEPFPHDDLGDISNHIVRLYARLQQALADRDREHRAALHQQREKERIKKQLTNNINHELKTPVASIRVCLETLLTHENLSAEKRREWLLRCLSNTDRLKRLLDDVSLITRMDDGGAAISRSRVSLSAVIAETVADLAPAAEARGIVIENGVTAPLFLDNANPSLLESIFHNLIDNAIAYSGGSLIAVSLLSADSRRIVITVSDNGAGVPPEHLPRIFERFYRIDKGRSRAAGGTGLGLSIVRNAVLFHNGSITVRNLASGGLCFTVTFSLGPVSG